jgi:hypothetical protein
VEERLKQKFSSLFQDPQMSEWYRQFFGGTDPATWPDELQAMVLGIEVDGQRLSEANLMAEWLSGQDGLIPRELAQYTGTLVPFGHLGPYDEIKERDMQNFCALLHQSGLFGNVQKPILEPAPKPTRWRCEVA